MKISQHIRAKTSLGRALSITYLAGSIFLLYLNYVQDGNLALGILPLLAWGFIFNSPPKLVEDIYEDAEEMIRGRVDGSVDTVVWQEFLARGMNGDARFMELQRLLSEVPDRFPPQNDEDHCGQKGKDFMLRIADLISTKGWNLEDLRQA